MFIKKIIRKTCWSDVKAILILGKSNDYAEIYCNIDICIEIINYNWIKITINDQVSVEKEDYQSGETAVDQVLSLTN